jgi:hypothetical protein
MAPIPETLPSGEYILLPSTPLLPWTEEGLAELTIWTKLFVVRFVTNLFILSVIIGLLAGALYLALHVQRQVARAFRCCFGRRRRGRFAEVDVDDAKSFLAEPAGPPPPSYSSDALPVLALRHQAASPAAELDGAAR